MPELDSTSPFAHLINLCREYQELVELLQSGMLETDDMLELNGQRSVLHEQVMEEMDRLQMPYTDRVDAMEQAITLARWFGME